MPFGKGLLALTVKCEIARSTEKMFDKFLSVLFSKFTLLLIILVVLCLMCLSMTGCFVIDILGGVVGESGDVVTDSILGTTDGCSSIFYGIADCYDECMFEIVGCDGDCAVTSCLYNPEGCTSECGDCYVECGGLNETILFSACDSNGWGDGCYDYEGHDRVNCFNCTAYCDGVNDPGSPNYQHVKLYDIQIMDAYGELDDFELYVNTYSLPYVSQKYLESYDIYLPFMGYYTEPDGKGTCIADKNGRLISVPAENAILYPLYTDRFYNDYITFVVKDANGNTVSEFSAKPGQSLRDVLPGYDAIEGYEIKQWTISGDGYGSVVIGDSDGYFDEYVDTFNTYKFSHCIYDYDGRNSAPTLYLKPVMDVKSMSVTIYYNGQRKVITVDYGTTLGDALKEYDVTVPDLTFAGVTTIPSGGVVDLISTDTVIKTDVTYYAVFAKEIKLTFDDGVSRVEKVYYSGQSITLPEPTNVPPGKEFMGWKFNNSALGTGTYKELYIDDSFDGVVMSASWALTVYKITYIVDGKEYEVDTYQYGDSLTLLSEVQKQFYDFAGWCSTADLSGNIITSLPDNHYGDVTLYAKFTPKKYTIILVSNGGTISSSVQTVEYGSNFTLPVPQKTGYTFEGWYYTYNGSQFVTNADGKSKFTFTIDNFLGKASENDLNFTVYAQWNITQNKVTFMSQGKVYQEIRCDYNSVVAKPENPSVLGHDFVRWIDASTGREFDFSTLIKAPVTLVAEFAPKTYNITLKLNSGVLYNKQTGAETTRVQITFTYGDEFIKELSNYELRNAQYSFIGWFIGTDSMCISADGQAIYAYLDRYLANYNGTLELTGRWS